jgi:hypothetical protein
VRRPLVFSRTDPTEAADLVVSKTRAGHLARFRNRYPAGNKTRPQPYEYYCAINSISDLLAGNTALKELCDRKSQRMTYRGDRVANVTPLYEASSTAGEANMAPTKCARRPPIPKASSGVPESVREIIRRLRLHCKRRGHIKAIAGMGGAARWRRTPDRRLQDQDHGSRLRSLCSGNGRYAPRSTYGLAIPTARWCAWTRAPSN